MKPIAASLLMLLTLFDASSAAAEPRIVRVDPAFDTLVPKNAALEKLADGFKWVEGPVWHRKGNFLLFSDIPQNAVIKWEEGKGTSVFLERSGFKSGAAFTGREPGSNGLAFDAEGRLILCEHGDRCIGRVEGDGTRTTLADRFEGKRFNSPNDLAIRSNGDLYFTDPPYGLPGGMKDPAREIPFLGVYRLKPSGEVSLVTREVAAPNGIAFSPDEKTLYVASSDPRYAVWWAFAVAADGTVGKGRIFFDATKWAKERKPGSPDGFKVDTKGNLFASGPGGIHVFSPAGKHLGSFEFDVPVSNCGWGNDGSVLYMTANTAIYRVKLSTRGAGF